MADDRVSDVTRSTFNSIVSLQSVVKAIPQLEGSSLDEQLLATSSLCIELQQHPGLLDSESSEQVVNVLGYIGRYALHVKTGIEASPHSASVDWTTYQTEGRTIFGIAAFLQILTCSVFVGAVHQALLVNNILPPIEKRTDSK